MICLTQYPKSKPPIDFIHYKKMRAKARVLIRFSKKQSWSTFICSINEPGTCSSMWNSIKKSSGSKSSYHIPLLILVKSWQTHLLISHPTRILYQNSDLTKILQSHQKFQIFTPVLKTSHVINQSQNLKLEQQSSITLRTHPPVLTASSEPCSNTFIPMPSLS